jgi:hypothetical protein
MLEWAKFLHEAIGIESPRLFILAFALFGFFSAGFVGWGIDRAYRVKLNQDAEKQASTAESPYIILDYLKQQHGPSGFYLRNDGRQNALRVQINNTRAGNKVATFGEIASVRNDGSMTGTYSTGTDLDEVLQEIPVDNEGKATLAVRVDYYGFDGERQFQTECVFQYQRGRGLSLLSCKKKS